MDTWRDGTKKMRLPSIKFAGPLDWPMIGAVSALTVVAGFAIFEVSGLIRSGTEPVRKQPQLSRYERPVERSIYELPGFGTGGSTEPPPSFPLMRLIDPDRTYSIEGGNPPLDPPPPPTQSKKTPPSTAPAKVEARGDPKTAKPVAQETKSAALEVKPVAVEPQPRPVPVQWRVIVTSKASYFNLGGHVSSAGIVDSLASGHLRDALKVHKNFPQLPSDIKTHILTQDINLPKIAPYRGLLGISDKVMEEEQGIRFERVAARG
ncbi:hypothetical protein CI1B_63590 [Bradyrhizobium ivorense]|uniref:Uncharacterized protein n=2 Tax=Bradyrhizobium ivorense TaxID=2511166 RepID=A0A508TQ79_9BRAD|nr:hypothetical protein CI1B_63590 [Bradyrhizobium ivorense]